MVAGRAAVDPGPPAAMPIGRIRRDWSAWIIPATDNTARLDFAVDHISCAACMGAIAGQPFLAKAWRALSHGAVTMDVPTSVGVILATGYSFFTTLTHAREAYFNSALMLPFFRLSVRTLAGRPDLPIRSAAAPPSPFRV